jgi:hypothetical protein
MGKRKMLTYKELQTMHKKEFGKTLKSCWIADVKREQGLIKRIAHNRIDSKKVKYPCPDGAPKTWLIEKLNMGGKQ